MSDAAGRAGERAAWADYWADMGAARPGCLPHQIGGVEQLLRSTWSEFAAALPRGSRVLDIGTGNGIVLAHMAGRRDLKLTGVDTAPRLPPAGKAMRLLPGVAAEALPFPDGGFDAIVSQFGFEYAEVAAAAAEAARVLKPGGAIRMVIHHRGSPILAHNLARRAAILWVRDDQRLLERARAFATARAMAALPLPDLFTHAPREADRRFAGAGAGAELAEAVRRTLVGGVGRPAPEVLAVLAILERKAAGEVGRVDSLARAARDDAGMDELRGMLGDAAIEIAGVRTLALEGMAASPLAWLVDGRKRQRPTV